MPIRNDAFPPLQRRAALGAGLASLAGGLAAPRLARAQAWPSRPVTIVVGFPPGGQTDFAARMVQNGMAAALGQPVVIDNRGGAGGNLGTEMVLRARPDGYTLLAANSSSMAINPHTFPRMTIDPLQLVSIGLILKSGLILCVHPSVPARDVPEFAAWVRAQRQGVNYGTPALGQHVPLRDGAVPQPRRAPRDGARPLPRQRPGDAGLHRRPVQRDVRRRVGGRVLCEGEPGARHPRHRRAAHPRLPRHPDLGRAGRAGLHPDQLDRPVRPARHAARGHRSASTPR